MKRLLIVNRGEIAVRIIRAARQLNIESVLVCSDADLGTIAARLADEIIQLGGSRAAETYLHQEKLVTAVHQCGADAVHPGYGFLAENAEFAARLERESITLVGPTAETIRLMGDKAKAREIAIANSVPVVPGTEPGLSDADLRKQAKKIGYPVMLKAVAGGSGRGMRIVQSEKDLLTAASEAASEAKAAFDNDTLILEKYIEKPRHIEVQVFGDGAGRVVIVGDRECSLQRRHQKLVEEAPAPRLTDGLRKRIHEAARCVSAAVAYRGAGTVEFILSGGDEDSDPFYFLEMNTRIQVEHPVTEEVSGVDLVQQQLLLAGSGQVSLRESDIVATGHSLEFRINAESPAQNFSPSVGEIRYAHFPGGFGIRNETWVESGSVVSPFYDALLAKLIVTDSTRERAIARAAEALAECHIDGVDTTLGFHRWAIQQQAFLNSTADVTWVERTYKGECPAGSFVGPAVLPVASAVK